MSGPKCDYCGSNSKLVKAESVYRGDFGAKVKGEWMYVCGQYPKCDAYVGCHRGTKNPLGRLADKKLRKAKIAAHAAFDRLWKAKVEITNAPKRKARNAGYRWLAQKLGIPWEQCHIGMFDASTCKRVVEICSPYLQGRN